MQARVVRSLVEGPLSAVGLVVEDVTVSPAGRRSVVRIAVDRSLAALPAADDSSPVAPLSLDDVADATRVVDGVLDSAAELGSAPYVLEVSSPGVDRPLTQWRHLRRNVGRLVTLRLHDGGTAAGRLLAVGPDLLALAADPATGEGPARSELRVDAVREGRVVLEFGHLHDEALDEDDVDDEPADLADESGQEG